MQLVRLAWPPRAPTYVIYLFSLAVCWLCHRWGQQDQLSQIQLHTNIVLGPGAAQLHTSVGSEVFSPPYAVLGGDHAVPPALESTAIRHWYGATGSCYVAALPGEVFGDLENRNCSAGRPVLNHCLEESELIPGDWDT